MSCNHNHPKVSIIMGSTSDFAVMRKAAEYLDSMGVPFEINALSAHRTPKLVAQFAEEAEGRGIKVIIAGAGGAAHLPGVIAASTILPVIGVPIRSSNSVGGLDSILSILQMPSGIPVATVGLDAAENAAVLATQIIAVKCDNMRERVRQRKATLAEKVTQANEALASEQFDCRKG